MIILWSLPVLACRMKNLLEEVVFFFPMRIEFLIQSLEYLPT